jgi:hypothetical protein
MGESLVLIIQSNSHQALRKETTQDKSITGRDEREREREREARGRK